MDDQLEEDRFCGRRPDRPPRPDRLSEGRRPRESRVANAQHARHAVPQRLDEQDVHRDGRDAARRGRQALARRYRRQGHDRLSERGCGAKGHHPASARSYRRHRGLLRTGVHEEPAHAEDARRLCGDVRRPRAAARARRGVPLLELRHGAPRRDHRARERTVVLRLRPHEGVRAGRHDVNRLAAGNRYGPEPVHRLHAPQRRMGAEYRHVAVERNGRGWRLLDGRRLLPIRRSVAVGEAGFERVIDADDHAWSQQPVRVWHVTRRRGCDAQLRPCRRRAGAERRSPGLPGIRIRDRRAQQPRSAGRVEDGRFHRRPAAARERGGAAIGDRRRRFRVGHACGMDAGSPRQWQLVHLSGRPAGSRSEAEQYVRAVQHAQPATREVRRGERCHGPGHAADVSRYQAGRSP